MHAHLLPKPDAEYTDAELEAALDSAGPLRYETLYDEIRRRLIERHNTGWVPTTLRDKNRLEAALSLQLALTELAAGKYDWSFVATT